MRGYLANIEHGIGADQLEEHFDGRTRE